MSEEMYNNIIFVWCIGLVVFVIGFTITSICIGNDLENGVLLLVGGILMCIPVTVLIDYGLHKLWHFIG